MTAEEHSEPKLPAARSRWFSSLVFGAIIFACGTATGVTIGLNWDSQDEGWRRGESGERRSYAERMTAHLTEELELSSDQAAQVYSILDRHTQEFRDIHATISPKLKEQMDCLRDEVGACLDDRQRELWEAKVERLRKRTRAHF